MFKSKMIGVDDVVDECLKIEKIYKRKFGLDSPLEAGYLGQQRALYFNDARAAELIEVITSGWSSVEVKEYLCMIITDLRDHFPEMTGKEWRKRTFIGYNKLDRQYAILIPFIVEDDVLVDKWEIRAQEISDEKDVERFSEDDFPQLSKEAKNFVYDVNSAVVFDEIDFTSAESLLRHGWTPKKPETSLGGSDLPATRNTRKKLRRL